MLHPLAARTNSSAARTAMGIGAALAGVLGIGAIWTVLNLRTDAFNGWGALVAAADAALLLRLAGMAAGRTRALIGVTAVLATAVLVGFLTAAVRLGLSMGLRPLEAAERMSSGLAWTLTQSAATGWDLLGLLVALPLAWWLCR